MKRLILKQIKGDIVHYVDNYTETNFLRGDGMITTTKDLVLTVYGADCAIIAFWDDKKIGVCHAGWQGYSLGLIKKMAQQFQGGECYVGPFIHNFEITRDACYDRITRYSGNKFLNVEDKIIFDYRSAVINELSNIRYHIDHRDTFHDETLGSNRRGYLHKYINTQNRLSIWNTSRGKFFKFFKPYEDSQEYFKYWKIDKTARIW